ncbi:Speckle-type POZ protein B-like protein [Leptotrombidium deliense]|uniref:Speckle-type POZ protein B-like protein n=1 Tax=Leptotrombidium deliense TaxID=299467 RepID=A0A443S221_9ACAR|nr:Speckle-type POZ protein B-like protein [Leptotrombidium deliense]
MGSESVVGVTGCQDDVLRCEWIVKDFDNLQALNTRCITSPDFTGKRHTWYFLFDWKRNVVSVNLKDYDTVRKAFRATIVLEIYDLLNNMKWKSDEETATYGNSYHYCLFTIRGEATQLMQSGNDFKIFCMVKEKIEMSQIYLPMTAFKTNEPLCNFTKSMINCEEFSDVKIISNDGRVFDVHKFMISRSPVFKKMILSKLLESNKNEIKIDDLSGEALEKMLRFIYSDEVVDDDSIDAGYLLAAHKYELPFLTAKYGASLAKKASIENCIDLLILGDMTNCDELREPLLHFVALNRKEITETSGWDLLAAERPELLAKVVSMY